MHAHIRLAQQHDAPTIATIYAPFCEHTMVSFEYIAPSTDEMARRVGTITEQFPWLVLEDAGQVVDYAYASAHRDRAAYMWSADVAVYVDAEHRQRGVGRALYTALLHMLPLLGYYKAHAGVVLPNASSVALHTAMGFTPVGVYHNVGYKLGAWHNVQWFELTLQPPQSDPRPPRSVRTMIETREWKEAIRAGLAAYHGSKERV